MKKRLCGIIIVIMLTSLFANTFVIRAKADHGPKPSIDLKITDAPAYKYVVLLQKDSSTGKENSPLKIENLDKSAVEEYLRTFHYEGWRIYLRMGQIDIHERGESDSYSFTYSVPKPFKVLLVTDDGTVMISSELAQKEFNSECEFNVAKGTLTEKRAGKTISRVFYILSCYVITLIIEFLILLLFRYPLTKTNITAFLLINTITQLALNIFLAFSNASWGTVGIYTAFEIVIALTEGVFYAIKLRTKDGQKKPVRGFLYGVIANALSYGGGFLIYLLIGFRL